MKLKRMFGLIVLLLLLLALPIAASDTNMPYAEALDEIGLFRGTDKGYELERVTTRAEAVALVVRVLGKEDAALNGDWEHPFTDAGWADKYIGYAYENNLVKGISQTKFGATMPIDHKQYATLLLRVLGYSDDVGGQFKYNGAYEFACHKFAIEKGTDAFTRGELARLTYAALNAPLHGQSKTLAKGLMSSKVFTQSEFTKAKAKAPREAQKTAVLIYAVASDLESKLGMLSMDIAEILDAPTADIEILMQTGGTKNYRHTALHDGKTQRLRITDNALTEITVLDGAAMCERETLEAFLVYAKEHVVADRYVLVFWDHGEGTIGGFGRDELNGNASLSLDDMKHALGAFGQKFDLIVFDACLMGTLESAYALRDAAEFMIASEDMIPTDGIYYTTWLNSLSADPKLSTEELARLIVDAFVVHAPKDRENVMMSVVRLDRVDGVVNAASRLMDRLKEPAYLDRLRNAHLIPYGEGDGNDQYDLIKLFDTLDLDVSDLGVALEGALYYKRSAVSGADCGLAMYLPLVRNDDYANVKNDLLAIGYPDGMIRTLDTVNDKNGG